MRNVPGKRDSVLEGDLFDYNIKNHKYWIYKSINGMDLNAHTDISIEILDYKGQPIIEPNNKKKLKFSLSLNSFFRNVSRITRKNKKLSSNKDTNDLDNTDNLNNTVNLQEKVNPGGISNTIFNNEERVKPTGIATARGGNNQKTRKIKAKKTRKFRVKKPRKRSLR
jgi:hypothetical protein